MLKLLQVKGLQICDGKDLMSHRIKNYVWLVTLPFSGFFLDSINCRFLPIWRNIFFSVYKKLHLLQNLPQTGCSYVTIFMFSVSAMSIWSRATDVNGISLDLSIRVNVSTGLEKILSVLIIVTAGTITSQRATDNHCLLEMTEENYLGVEICTAFWQP